MCVSCRLEQARWQRIACAVTENDLHMQVGVVRPFTASWKTFQALLDEPSTRPISTIARVKDAFFSWWEALVDLTCMQLHLVRIETWLLHSLSLVLAVVLFCLDLSWETRIIVMSLGGTILASLCAAFISSGQDNLDLELLLTTVSSPRLLFLLRLTVFASIQLGFNGAIAFLLHQIYQPFSGAEFVIYWLAPLCFLFAVTALLATFLRSVIALMVALTLWLLRLGPSFAPLQLHLLLPYEQFWQHSSLLFICALLAVVCALLFVGGKETAHDTRKEVL
jgi:hypothetical protein